VLAGGVDSTARLELGRAVAKAIPEARFEVEETECHQPFQQVPDRWNARVDAFWQDVGTRPRTGPMPREGPGRCRPKPSDSRAERHVRPRTPSLDLGRHRAKEADTESLTRNSFAWHALRGQSAPVGVPHGSGIAHTAPPVSRVPNLRR
jgi:hypothetical protein